MRPADWRTAAETALSGSNPSDSGRVQPAERIVVAPDTSVRRDKLAIAHLLKRTSWNRAASMLERKFDLIRFFNYHGVPRRYAQHFEAQMSVLMSRYEFLDPHQLEDVLAHGPPNGGAAAFLTFDDGLENHYSVVAPILERLGIRAVFSVPADFPGLRRDEQIGWFRARIRRRPDAEHSQHDDLYGMTWPQLRDLVQLGHRVCSHSSSHMVLRRDTSPAVLRAEIVDSRARLEEEISAMVDGFCWPVHRDTGALAAQELVAATYTYALLAESRPLRRGHDPLEIYRTQIEASWPFDAVELQVSGVHDAIAYVRRLWRRAHS